MNGPCEIEVDEFRPWPKMARLSREIIVSEKIDGTNGQIYITDLGKMLVGSRTRWITSENDNYGFARWCEDHKEELMKLGPGRHFGEYWGNGIQRRYNLTQKRFSLFNAQRWQPAAAPELSVEWRNTLPGVVDTDGNKCACVSVVPVLYRGEFTTGHVDTALALLKIQGSQAAPGFMQPEGVIVYHVAAGIGFKKTLDGDEAKGTPNISVQ